MLDELLIDYSMKVGMVATILLLFLIILVLILQADKVKFNKVIFFGAMLLTILFPTFFFIGSAVYLNTVSISHGPVHWHADFEMWACGKEFDLIDPTGLSNKVGTPTLHEHNDKRIHLEGVVVEQKDASLGRFFQVVGGNLTASTLQVPTNQGMRTVTTGDLCPDGTPGVLQVFRYGVKDGKYFQEKLTDPAAFVIGPHGSVPPGDCFILEFTSPKETTDKLCRSFIVAEKLHKIEGGTHEH